MDAERWRLVEEVLHAAREREPDEREAWLVERCGDDRELAEEVRSLLVLEERAQAFLETPALAQDPPQIGPYDVVRRLSTGGSAVVYEALRDGGRYAVKVLRGGVFVDERRLRRFRREVEMLARLRHPAIARIYEAGETELGERYFSMEYVHGAPLTVSVRERGLSLDERLELFAALCDGVAYAHAQGLVHRDLKPDNLLVGEDGRPKILDFGIARWNDDTGLRRATTERTGEVLGTLRTMSPEQARGHPDDIDHRTDVYSLGVVLYELVTDRLPYDVTRVLPHEALRVICDEPPLRPSAVRPELRGALDTVVLQALEKDPARRYGSVRELADDVRALLAGRPVRAQPPGLAERTRRALRRNKLAVAAVGSVVLALGVFAVTAAVKNAELGARNRVVEAAEREARAQAARATRESRVSNLVLEFLDDALHALDPDAGHGRDVTLATFLDLLSDELAAAGDGPPLVRARLHAMIGRAYHALGRDRDAEPHLRARVALHAAHGPGAPSARAEAYEELARCLSASGSYAEALERFEAALALRREEGQDEAELAGQLLDTSRLLTRLGRRAEARERLDAALAAGQLTGAAAGAAAVEALELRAEILLADGDRAGAERCVERALELQREGGRERHTTTARLLALQAHLRIVSGRKAQAEAPLAASEAIRAERLDPLHPELIATRGNLATLYTELGRYDDAEHLLFEVLDAWRAAGLTELEDYAATLSTLGVLRAEQARYVDAAATLREALAVYRDAAADPDDLASHTANLARVLALTGELDEARELATEALDLRLALYGDGSPEAASSLALLGELTLAAGATEEAEGIYREVLRLHEATLPPDDPAIAFSANGLGVVLQARGELGEAEALFRRSLELSTRDLGPAHPRTALRRRNLAEVLLARGADVEGLAELERAHAGLRGALGPAHPDVVGCAATLASELAARGRGDAALTVAGDALEGARRAWTDEPDARAELWLLCARLCLERGDGERARTLLTECAAWADDEQLAPSRAAELRDLAARARSGGAPREAAHRKVDAPGGR